MTWACVSQKTTTPQGFPERFFPSDLTYVTHRPWLPGPLAASTAVAVGL